MDDDDGLLDVDESLCSSFSEYPLFPLCIAESLSELGEEGMFKLRFCTGECTSEILVCLFCGLVSEDLFRVMVDAGRMC